MRFSKWHAHGNSYLLVERAELGRPFEAEQARHLCDVRYGVGADGVLEVVSIDGGRDAKRPLQGSSRDEESASADSSSCAKRIELAIWNPDGSVAEFSGNGSRIAAAWLLRRVDGTEVVVTVSGRTYRASARGGEIELEIGPVEVRGIETIELAEERVELTIVSVGNPHAVVRRQADRAELRRLGPLLETHRRFPGRTNVQLVEVDGLHEASALVWERGAGETASSGSSAVAVAAATVANGWCESPVTVHLPGGDLRVTLDAENRATLTGPAEWICSGELDLGSA